MTQQDFGDETKTKNNNIINFFCMKAKFFAVAALMLGLASCQTDFDGVRGNAGGEVDFQLKVDAAELGATRADQDGRNGHDSAFGAIDYLTEADWNNVDLRYSLEVYEVKNNVVSDVPVKDRMVQIVDQYAPVTFDLRLIPSREYRFVVFADFVPEDSTAEVAGETLTDHNSDLGLFHTIGANLRDIKVVNDALFTECADAYFAFEDITVNNGEPHSLVLKRPYGKLRVVATDLAEINTNVNPTKVVVRYDAIHPAAFNAVTGEIAEEKAGVAEYSYEYAEVGTESLANHYYTKGYDAETIVTAENKTRHTHMTLFTDYILAEDDQRGVHFTLEVWDNEELIKSTDFDTEIPVQRNHLTTIIGNVMTTATEINVTIDDNFANMDREYYVFEAFANVEGYKAGINDGVVTLDRDYVIGNPIYVRAGINAVLNLNGHSIVNATENENTDVIIVEEGATLTINGEGIIEAVSGNDGYAVIAKGVVTINGGIFKAGVDENGEANAVVYARGNGQVYVNEGYFPNEAKSSFVLNKRDADRDTTVIEVRGGTFEYFDPMNNTAENAETNFVAGGFASFLEGEHTYVVRASQDYVIDGNTIYVYSAKGLMKWAYMAANTTNSPNLVLEANIVLPSKTIAADHVNETYTFTDEDIVVIDGVPSESNWPAISDYETARNQETGAYEYYGGEIEGKGHYIKGLRINHDFVASGFICWTKGAKVENLTFDNAVVYNKGGQYGETYTGTIVGRCWDGSHVNNCHVKNSSVLGMKEVGGIVGRVYRRTIKTNTADGQPEELMEDLAYVTYCTTDESTTVKGQSVVGGIVGMNYGCIVGQCVNNAQVSATGDYAGGIVGYHRSYTTKTDGYIIACRSTNKATITSRYAGGIAGYVLHDKNHLYTRSWIVGCASESTITGTTNSGGIIGNASNATISSCWALQNGTTKLVGKGSATNIASYMYSNATDATQADVDAMNAAIEAFNVSDHNISLDGTIGAVMLKRWVLVNGTPALQ